MTTLKTAVQQTRSVVVDNVISSFSTLRRLKFGSRKVVNLIIRVLVHYQKRNYY